MRHLIFPDLHWVIQIFIGDPDFHWLPVFIVHPYLHWSVCLSISFTSLFSTLLAICAIIGYVTDEALNIFRFSLGHPDFHWQPRFSLVTDPYLLWSPALPWSAISSLLTHIFSGHSCLQLSPSSSLVTQVFLGNPGFHWSPSSSLVT